MDILEHTAKALDMVYDALDSNKTPLQDCKPGDHPPMSVCENCTYYKNACPLGIDHENMA